MKKILCLMLCLAVCLAAASVLADKDPVSITVTGSGSISVVPDQMCVLANISSMDKELSVAQEEVSTTVNHIHDALEKIGISESDVVTTSYNCSTMYDYSQSPFVLMGYQTSHTLSITCHDLSLVDKVLETLVSNGSTEIYGIEFDVSNRKELYLNALELALGAAKEKAAVLVGAANLENYTIDDITEESNYSFSNYQAKETVSDKLTAGTGIHTGDVTIDASVRVEFKAR